MARDDLLIYRFYCEFHHYRQRLYGNQSKTASGILTEFTLQAASDLFLLYLSLHCTVTKGSACRVYRMMNRTKMHLQ